jgi:exodeoxyribonuclease VII small subunit
VEKKSKHSEGSQKESLTYQTMLDEVEGIVRQVSAGSLDLDDVVGKVERGYKLIQEMRGRLDATKSRIDFLRTEFESQSKNEDTK